MKAMPALEARDLERLRYWQGQMLRSRDFRDQLAIDAQLRWWHNRAMHHAFGIAFGFTTQKDETHQTINIESGLAYDWFGREIILRKEQKVSIPKLEEPITLLACYKDTRTHLNKRKMKGACLPRCCSSGFEAEPKFVWKPASRVEPQDGVPLITLSAGKVQNYTRTARALSRPYVVSGATIAGATQWETWSIPFIGTRAFQPGFQVTIDTSAAGFTEIPSYFAWLQGELWKLDGKENLFGVHLDHIEDVSTNGFTFRFLVLIEKLSQVKHGEQPTGTAVANFLLNFLQKQKFYISWLGIQPSREAH
jgi:hypothetical protein